jgi:hypothetical protein
VGTLLAVAKVACLLLLVASLAAACGSSSKVATTTNSQGKTQLACTGKVRFAKTKFVLHAGLAFGAFHRYILKPYRAGALAKGAPGRTKALAKAGASALFAYHELKVARTDAVCDGPRLRRLADSVSSALASLNALRALRAGTGLGAIGLAGQALDRLGGEAASGGTPIKDINR